MLKHGKGRQPLMLPPRLWPAVDEVTQMLDDDQVLPMLEKYLTLTAQERRKMHGAEIVTIGWFRTCLPALMSEQQQDDTERTKFLDSLNTHT
jgi:hypothetical protein